MTRILVLILAALLCSLFPPGVSAAGFLPPMPSLAGWYCAPEDKASCAVDGKLGYLACPKDFVFDMGTLPDSVQGITITNLMHQYAVQGIWAGTSARVFGPEGLCLALGASGLFPNNIGETELYNGGLYNRTWRPTTQWYTLDASASVCLWWHLSPIAGFRYDAFSTMFANASQPSLPLGVLSLPTDKAEVGLSSYMLYVGTETFWGPVRVGVRGFPWVPGTILYRETFAVGTATVTSLEATGNYRNAYFLETFAEVGGQLGAVRLSGFATYTLLHATGEFDALMVNYPIATYYPNGPPQIPIPTGQSNFCIDRQNWIVGGKAVIAFAIPL